ncbi:hypothetical protein EPK99_00520 [Neorhizobium lilium]|uniref:Uncharacterized protein n=1 Tax=Neorhizobium lilium TaxID=2503024 RepID=A0A3S3U351_9HYPH|nr:hypothetical protein [Neorhizobium lilium]RWX80863.1 hypothetical protein EPK99_00520 [Neorhizobium lilium]
MSNATQTGNQGDRNDGTSPNTFGRSVESKAQIADAETLATGTEAGETLNIYRLVPIAPPNDARWRGAPPSGDVIVAARTSGDARIVAAGAELDYMEIDAMPAEDVTTRNASLFRDEKAYTVIAIEFGRVDLRRGVIEGDLPVPNIKPVQV